MSRRCGTRAKYVAEKCHCPACRAANNAGQRRYRRRRAQIALGARPTPFVDAEPVRQHVRTLMAAGLGWKRIARLAGVSNSTVTKLLYGVDGRVPSLRVQPGTARKLLAVTTEQRAGGARIDATGTHRRLQALVAIGWSMASLARELGVDPTNLPGVLHQALVEAATASAVRDLYERLWNSPPPAGSPQQRAVMVRARRHAAARGWVPPLAWVEGTIDDPAAQPATGEPEPGQDPETGEIVDEVAIERAIRTGDARRLTAVERLHLVAILLDRGNSATQIAQVLHRSGSAVNTLIDAARHLSPLPALQLTDGAA